MKKNSVLTILGWGFMLGLMAAPSSRASQSAFETQRELDPGFAVDLSYVNRSLLSIQYFYVLMNEDGTFHEDDPIKLASNPFQKGIALDTQGELAQHQREEHPEDAHKNDMFVIFGKMAYVLDLDISVFKNRKAMMDPAFLKAMNPAMSRFEPLADGAGRFRMIGPHILPNSDLTMTYFADPFDRRDEIKNPGILKILDQDPALGKPGAVVLYFFDHFTNAALFFKASQASYSYLKFYRIADGRTLVVENVLIYPFGTLGGPEGMRKSALKQILPKAKALHEYHLKQ